MAYQQLPVSGHGSPYEVETVHNVVTEVLLDCRKQISDQSVEVTSDLEEAQIRIPYKPFFLAVSQMIRNSLQRMQNRGHLQITVVNQGEQVEITIADSASLPQTSHDRLALGIQRDLLEFGADLLTLQQPSGGTTRILAFPLR